MPNHQAKTSAFTLIELLVVIAIIALLLAIAIPSLVLVKEQARRVICKTNMRSFHLAAAAYATNNKGLLPPGGTDDPAITFIIIMKNKRYQSLTDNASDLLICPNLFKPYKGGNVNVFDHGSYIEQNDSALLGYNYLAGYPNTPWASINGDRKDSQETTQPWISPQKNSDSGRLTLLTELNTWIDGSYTITFAPHGGRGPIHEAKDSTNMTRMGIPSDEIGSVGGNLCMLDGSIEWKPIREMSVRRASTDPSIDLFALW